MRSFNSVRRGEVDIDSAPHNKGTITEKTLEIIELALNGKRINEIAHKLELPYTTVSDIVRKYTKVKRVLIKALPIVKMKLEPRSQLKLNLNNGENE